MSSHLLIKHWYKYVYRQCFAMIVFRHQKVHVVITLQIFLMQEKKKICYQYLLNHCNVTDIYTLNQLLLACKKFLRSSREPCRKYFSPK